MHIDQTPIKQPMLLLSFAIYDPQHTPPFIHLANSSASGPYRITSPPPILCPEFLPPPP